MDFSVDAALCKQRAEPEEPENLPAGNRGSSIIIVIVVVARLHYLE